MPLNPPPTIAANLALCKTVFVHYLVGREVEVTYAVVDVAGTLTAQAIANAAETAFTGPWSVIMDHNVTILRTEVRRGDGTAVPSVAVSTNAPVAATNLISADPANNNALIKKGTGLGGRKNRGRTFMPYCWDESVLAPSGNIGLPQVAGIQTAATAWRGNLVGASIPMCIANKTFSSPLPPHHVTSVTEGPLVTTLTVEQLIASQRRRIGR